MAVLRHTQLLTLGAKGKVPGPVLGRAPVNMIYRIKDLGLRLA